MADKFRKSNKEWVGDRQLWNISKVRPVVLILCQQLLMALYHVDRLDVRNYLYYNVMMNTGGLAAVAVLHICIWGGSRGGDPSGESICHPPCKCRFVFCCSL